MDTTTKTTRIQILIAAALVGVFALVTPLVAG